MTTVASMMLWASLAAPGPGEIICESGPVLERYSRQKNYILRQVTRCYPATDPDKEQLTKLKLACDLLITAYGKEEGQLRCRDLLAHLEVEP